MIKPFVKWAGGKTNVISQIVNYLPIELIKGEIKKYAEPFIGGGAMLLHILQNYNVETAYISDINSKLITTYLSIKNNPYELIEKLNEIEKNYIQKSVIQKEEYFYELRNTFNDSNIPDIDIASHFIALNKTCFNGLFRVNSKGIFNVGWGKHDHPKISDPENILNISKLLQKVEIVVDDYTKCFDFLDYNTFIQLDPPYLVSENSNFTQYTKEKFDTIAQIKLANFYEQIHRVKDSKIMMSNSNHSENQEDNFFNKMYSQYNMHKIMASRNINSNGSGRQKVSEVLITNY